MSDAENMSDAEKAVNRLSNPKKLTNPTLPFKPTRRDSHALQDYLTKYIPNTTSILKKRHCTSNYKNYSGKAKKLITKMCSTRKGLAIFDAAIQIAESKEEFTETDHKIMAVYDTALSLLNNDDFNSMMKSQPNTSSDISAGIIEKWTTNDRVKIAEFANLMIHKKILNEDIKEFVNRFNNNTYLSEDSYNNLKTALLALAANGP